MARVLNGSSQYMSASSTLLTNEPIGMFAWVQSNSVAAAQTIISLGNSGGGRGFYEIDARGDVASDPIQINKDTDAGSLGTANTTAGYTTSWATVGASFRSDTSRDVYLNGTNKGSDTTNIADPTPDFVTIGARRVNAVSLYFNGSIAEAFLFNVDPTDAQHAILAKGFHPIYAGIPFSNIRGWYPLLGDDNNRVGGGYPNLSPTGSPTFGSHPTLVTAPRLGSRCSL